MTGTVVYVAAAFPTLSETFVYREVLALRETGLQVPVVSVRPGEERMGDEVLNALAREAVPVYGSGLLRLGADVMIEALSHPLRSVHTLARAFREAWTERDVSGTGARLKVMAQGVFSLAVARRVRPWHPNLLHAQMAHVPCTFARYAAGQLGVPFSFTGHAADLFRDRCLLTVKLREAAFVHSISYWHRSFYRELSGRDEADLPVVRCGVDPDAFPRGVPEEGARGEGEGIRLLAVGRLVPKKGFDLLLEALADEALASINWSLTLVGEGPEKEALQAQRGAHPHRDRIVLTGALPNHEVQAAMSRCDVFVLPCRVDAQGDRDGIPVVLMEAMAAGAAVVCGDVPSIRELVEEGETGRMIPPGRVSDLTRALVALCGDPEERRRLAEAGRRRVVDEFSLQAAVRRIEENLTRRRLVTP